MLDYINNNLSGFWVALGFGLLAAEVLLFGFSTIIFLFAGLGALVTGLLMMVGILPETWIAGISGFGITTGISSVLLWIPLKKMQGKSKVDRKPQSDFIGLEFVLAEDISTTNSGVYHYSGIDWKVELDRSSDLASLQKGTRVNVVSVDVGVFRVNSL